MKKRARPKTYHETSRARDRASERRGLKDEMRLKRAPHVPKTQQKSLTGEDVDD